MLEFNLYQPVARHERKEERNSGKLVVQGWLLAEALTHWSWDGPPPYELKDPYTAIMTISGLSSITKSNIMPGAGTNLTIRTFTATVGVQKYPATPPSIKLALRDALPTFNFPTTTIQSNEAQIRRLCGQFDGRPREAFGVDPLYARGYLCPCCGRP